MSNDEDDAFYFGEVESYVLTQEKTRTLDEALVETDAVQAAMDYRSTINPLYASKEVEAPIKTNTAMESEANANPDKSKLNYVRSQLSHLYYITLVFLGLSLPPNHWRRMFVKNLLFAISILSGLSIQIIYKPEKGRTVIHNRLGSFNDFLNGCILFPMMIRGIYSFYKPVETLYHRRKESTDMLYDIIETIEDFEVEREKNGDKKSETFLSKRFKKSGSNYMFMIRMYLNIGGSLLMVLTPGSIVSIPFVVANDRNDDFFQVKAWPKELQLYRTWWWTLQLLFYAIIPPVILVCIITFMLSNHGWSISVKKMSKECLDLLLKSKDYGADMEDNTQTEKVDVLSKISSLIDETAKLRKQGYVKQATEFSGTTLLANIIAFILVNGLVIFDLITGQKNSGYIHDGALPFIAYLLQNYCWIWVVLTMIYSSSKPSKLWDNFVTELRTPLNVGLLSGCTPAGTDVVAMLEGLSLREKDFTWVFFGVAMTRQLYGKVTTSLYSGIFIAVSLSLEAIDFLSLSDGNPTSRQSNSTAV